MHLQAIPRVFPWLDHLFSERDSLLHAKPIAGMAGVNLNITVRQGVDKKPWHSQKLAKLERDHGLFIQEDGAEYPVQSQVFI